MDVRAASRCALSLTHRARHRAAPATSTSQGVFFQDRASFGSMLAAHNHGAVISSQVADEDWERVQVYEGLPTVSFAPRPPKPSPSPSALPGYHASIEVAESRPRGPPCGSPLTFVRYEPSPFEVEWETRTAGSGAWGKDPCAALREPAQREKAQKWLDIATPYDKPATFPTAAATLADPSGAILSRMHYVDAVTNESVVLAIEPLAGILRDPRSICLDAPHGLVPDNSNVQSKEFLVLDPAGLSRAAAFAAADRRSHRVILFDLGATRWTDANWPGLRWLHDVYRAAGLRFTDILAWEPNAAHSNGFWNEMPPEVVAVTRFYNVGADSAAGSRHNPLVLLRELAQPGDYVVFKLDIDQFSPTGTSLEEQIVLGILNDPAIACLVDELFFEHHVANPAMMTLHWGSGVQYSLHESLRLFQALRRVGVLAHSWP